jgi:hypothetical protein
MSKRPVQINSSETKATKFDWIVARAKNNWVVAICLVAVSVIVGLASVTDALKRITPPLRSWFSEKLTKVVYVYNSTSRDLTLYDSAQAVIGQVTNAGISAAIPALGATLDPIDEDQSSSRYVVLAGKTRGYRIGLPRDSSLTSLYRRRGNNICFTLWAASWNEERQYCVPFEEEGLTANQLTFEFCAKFGNCRAQP